MSGPTFHCHSVAFVDTLCAHPDRCLVRSRGLEEAGQFGEHVQGGLTLQRRQHVDYLLHGLETLSAGHASLDASRPWLCYWILHSLAILNALPDEETLNRAAAFLARCQVPFFDALRLPVANMI